MQVAVKDFRVLDNSTIKGFFTLELSDIGMSIKDCKLVSRKDGTGFFIGWPSVKDQAGAYKNFIFLNKDSKAAETFQEEVIKKLDKYLK
jgi:hypothetical protein